MVVAEEHLPLLHPRPEAPEGEEVVALPLPLVEVAVVAVPSSSRQRLRVSSPQTLTAAPEADLAEGVAWECPRAAERAALAALAEDEILEEVLEVAVRQGAPRLADPLGVPIKKEGAFGVQRHMN